MSLFLVLALAGALSWVLRVALITMLPADRLPGALRDALDHLPPAVLAAIVAAELFHQVATAGGAGAGGAGAGGHAGAVAAPLVAAAVAGAVAWRTRNLAACTVAGLAVMGLLTAAHV